MQRSPAAAMGTETQDNITLSGQVRTWAGHDAVISAAWTANGVIDVRDELHVTG